VGLRFGLDVCEKISPPPGFDPRTVQPVASPTELPGPHTLTDTKLKILMAYVILSIFSINTHFLDNL
jgi:hypothetical protein